MRPYRHIKDPFDHARNLAYIRSCCQAKYRGEQWDLTFEEFCNFWHSWDLWEERGRAEQDLVLTRYDVELPWNTSNCCIITRGDQLRAKIERRHGRDDRQFFKGAIWYARR